MMKLSVTLIYDPGRRRAFGLKINTKDKRIAGQEFYPKAVSAVESIKDLAEFFYDDSAKKPSAPPPQPKPAQ